MSTQVSTFNRLQKNHIPTSSPFLFQYSRLGKTNPWNFNSRNGLKSPKFPCLAEFVSQELISRKRRVRYTIEPIIEARGLRYNSTSAFGKRGVGASFQQEVSICRFSGFRPRNMSFADLESTLNRMSKWLLVVLFGTILVCKHDGEALWAASGSVVNAGISTILKKLLNQNRPLPALRSDPGMPSSHAQSIFFIFIFTIVSLFECLGTNVFTISLSGLTLAFGSYLSWLRVTQQFHTKSQVVAGAVLGATFSILWFYSWYAVGLEAFASVLWVRVIVVAGAVAYFIGLLMHITRNLIYSEDHKM